MVVRLENLYTHLCPYHYLKYLTKNNKADIYLCPYNYVLDANVRDSIGINLEGAIIIFDEAHNLETFSEESCSMDVDIDDLLYTLKIK